MAQWQGQSNRKSTGGRLVLARGKRKFEISREKQYTKLGTETRRQYRGRGKSYKTGMLAAEFANVVDKKTQTVKKVKKWKFRKTGRMRRTHRRLREMFRNMSPRFLTRSMSRRAMTCRSAA